MLTIVYAPEGAARRNWLREKLIDAAKRAHRVLLFVPEQQVLEAEGFVCSLPLAKGAEVTSFKRMANSIFRRYGGLCYHYIGSGAKQIVMWRALSSVAPALKAYRNLSWNDMATIRLLVSTVEEMKIYNVTPDQLDEAAALVDDSRLADKVADIALIYAAYATILHEKHDDASDDIARAASLLEKKDEFAGCEVFFDSFDGFTPQQELLLRHVFAESEEVTVTLAYEKKDKRSIFAKLHETDRRLRRLASDCRLAVSDEQVAGFSENKAIAYFASRIWRDPLPGEKTPPAPAADETIFALRCPGVYEEARFIAADIARRVEEGARYRDFAIIVRHCDRYLGILDAALEGAGIPYFLSIRKDVRSMTAIRMLLSMLDIHIYNWRFEDVMAYLRCGLCGLSQEECDLLEEYAAVWHISGKRWYDEYGWQMNPFGFSAAYDDKATERLALLNQLREKLTRPLMAFFEVFSNKPTVRSVSAALVRFLLASEIPRKLSRDTEQDPVLFADAETADDYALLYTCLIDSLDQLVEVAGEMPITSREYASLFSMLLSEADIGKLPSRCDEVTVGNADLIRKSDTAHVYIMGLCEGEFPLAEGEHGAFDRKEKETLLSLGIETSPDGERRYADEKLYFYRAVTSARESVTMTYSYRKGDGSEQYPSAALCDTLALFGREEIPDYSRLPVERLLYGLPEILEYSVTQGYDLKMPPESGFVGGNYAFSQPLDALDDTLPQVVTDSLFGRKIPLTQSRMDRFVNCRFAYHCTYSLKLNEGASGTFESVDIGNYVHKILETFFASVRDELKTLSDEEAGVILDGILDDYVKTISRGNLSRRFSALIARLRRTTRLLVFNLLEEFRHSDFVPTFFELPISVSGEDGVKASVIRVSEDLSVSVTGVIDRVDTYRRGKDTYLRVVDYKTGSKSFSMSDVALGLNLQMLLYLFALSSPKNTAFREKLGCEGTVYPAGVLYFSLGAKSAESDKYPESAEQSRDLMEKKIARSGVLLNDPAILAAMEKELAGRFIPVTLSSGGEVKAGRATTLKTLEEWGALAQKVESAVAAVARELKKGSAQSRPLNTPLHTPCAYCRMKPICRMNQRKVDAVTESQNRKAEKSITDEKEVLENG